jgi:mRNA interferase RelE/StbE
VPFTVRYHPAVKTEDLPKIDAGMRDRLRRAIEERLMTEPHKYGAPLRKNLKGYWKLRVGDYRVVYTIGTDQEVIVLIICHRRGVYQMVPDRMP